jgi:arylformamidase
MLIYKQYDQTALDRQYNNRLHVADFSTHIERWELLSKQTEKEFQVIKNIAYGSLPLEQLDIYPSGQRFSKTLIFIHGGYWHKWDKSSFQFIAKAFRHYNITTVLINYPLSPGASIDQISASCLKAIDWLHQNIATYNGDCNQFFVTGHSAGAHLAAMLLTTTDLFKGACVISGLFNLIPICLSDLNQLLNIDTATAIRNSPVQRLPMVQSPLAIIVGSDETDEFQDQSRELYTSWKDIIPVDLVQAPGLNHYSILETILDPESRLHRLLLRLMKI